MSMAFVGVIRRIALMMFFLAATTVSLAQNLPTRPPSSSGSSSSMNFDFKFDESLGISFYVDALGLEASKLPFSPEVRINPSEYILGPNDLLGVIITGTFSLNYRALLVNMEGSIYLPSVGQVDVAGLTLIDARRAIVEAVEKLYRNVSVDVMLDRPRPLTIHVSGDIPNPGRIAVPYGTRLDAPVIGSLLTASQANTSSSVAEAASGSVIPSITGLPSSSISDASKNDLRTSSSNTLEALLVKGTHQLRTVRITRKDGTTVFADLIDYFYGGNLGANPILLDGDHISVLKSSPSDPVVSLTGAVYSQITVQYRSDDTLERLLRISGGLTSNADSSSVRIFRVGADSTYQLAIDLRQDISSDSLVMPRDRIVVGEKTRNNSNASITVVGRAKSTGIYPIVEGVTTAYDVLLMAGGLELDALKRATFIIRNESPSGMSGVSGSTNFAERIRGSDQYVQGLNWFEIEEKARKNRVFFDSSNEDVLRSIRMFDGDSLLVPRDERTVFIYGQVNNPGFTLVDSTKTLDDYISSVGGYSIAADTLKVYVIKVGARNWVDARTAPIESGDWVYVDRIPLDDLAQKRVYELEKISMELEEQSKQRLYELQKQTLELEELTQRRLYELQVETLEFDVLSQQRLFELQKIALEIQETTQQRVFELQLEGFKIQRRGLFVSAFAAVLSAVSTTVALVIYNRN